MIKNPYAIAAVLLGIECAILWVASHPRTKHFFDIIPSVFYIYFLPMMASSVGFIDAKSPLYGFASSFLLPMSLFILLVTVDIKAIARLGGKALFMFFAGGMGIGLGVVLAFWMFKPVIGGEFWAGFGALSGSWTGGSANMIAVKEALGTPDAIFAPMVIVDTVVPYAWMGLLVILSQHQDKFDRWNKSDRGVLEQLSRRMTDLRKVNLQWRFWPVIGIIFLAAAGALFAKSITQYLPVIQNIITPFAWTIIVVSLLGILGSFTKLKRIEQYQSNAIGYFILYFVLTTIGAKASIVQIGNALILIAAGCVIIVIHAAVLLTAGRALRVPLFLTAVASQANVGGVASAPMVAEIYQKGFASVGLLLAILGNIIGTYFGIAVGQICRIL